ncbi:hypothetical protein EB001_25955, partial [bacterium]|nr:hypothetical protein [bacterium]
LDTTSATSPTLKFFDGADDISLATVNYTTNTVDWLDSSVTITGLSTTATGTVLTLTDTAHTTTVNMVCGNNTALRFNELTANGSNYIGLKAPASLSADLTFTLPSTDGTSGQFLKTDGAGNLSFATAGLTGATSTATGTVLTLSDTQNVASVNVILDNQKELRFRETTANGTNYVGLKAPASLSADLTYTLPSADGTSGQVLQTNGSGVLSFAGVSASAGQVIQVKTATDDTARSTTSGTYVTASNTLSLSITPSSTSNKILLILSSMGTANTYGNYLTIFRNSTNLGSANGENAFFNLEGFGGVTNSAIGVHYLDSPATTSAITYEVRFKVGGSISMYLNYGNVRGSLTAMEIKG